MTDKEILDANESSRQPVECWTRVMGYFRPYSQFNNGKKSEFDERVWFTESNVWFTEGNACPCEMEKAV